MTEAMKNIVSFWLPTVIGSSDFFPVISIYSGMHTINTTGNFSVTIQFYGHQHEFPTYV